MCVVSMSNTVVAFTVCFHRREIFVAKMFCCTYVYVKRFKLLIYNEQLLRKQGSLVSCLGPNKQSVQSVTSSAYNRLDTRTNGSVTLHGTGNWNGSNGLLHIMQNCSHYNGTRNGTGHHWVSYPFFYSLARSRACSLYQFRAVWMSHKRFNGQHKTVREAFHES